MFSTATAPPVRALDDVHEPAVRAAVDALIAHPATLGFTFCGSRAAGFATPEADYDGFALVTREHYRSLDVEAQQVLIYSDEGDAPKRVIGDFSLFSEDVLEEALRSPLDIDHWPWVDAVIVADRNGALAAWRDRLAAFPEAQRKERAIHRYIQMVIALHYAIADDVRGFEMDRQINLHRAALAAVHLWFTLRGRWAPPLKWLTREIERLEIRPDTRAILEGAVLNPSIEMLTHVRDHMKSDMRYSGITEVDDLRREFFKTLTPERRPAVYRDSYL
ncbi:MAG TPA: DUF4037 domain-containing protein [Candidatus Eisenbacteria bacterium]|nr:DUF4037 domain-containing protein [Candidatus Eisenbacteria bacterium]